MEKKKVIKEFSSVISTLNLESELDLPAKVLAEYLFKKLDDIQWLRQHINKGHIPELDLLHNIPMDSSQSNSQCAKKKVDYDDEFEKAFILYERKGSKSVAFQKWMRLSPEEKQMVFLHIPHYISAYDFQYRKDFSGYLNLKYFNNVVCKNNVIIYDPNKTRACDEKMGKETLIINGTIYK